MGIANVNKSLASNRMVFELRRDEAALERFRADFTPRLLDRLTPG